MNHLGKRICAALLAGAMTMALAACGQSETGTTGEAPRAPQEKARRPQESRLP